MKPRRNSLILGGAALALMIAAPAFAQNAPPPGNVNPGSMNSGAEESGAPNQPRSFNYGPRTYGPAYRTPGYQYDGSYGWGGAPVYGGGYYD